jgi:carbamoyltransferase
MTAPPYMTFAVDVREEHRGALPEITHINGSARVQMVLRADNPDFHTLLRQVGARTGRKMVLNTRFNEKDSGSSILPLKRWRPF